MSIMAIITAILAEYGVYLALGAVALGAFGWWTLRQRRAGRREAEARTRKANLESVERQNEAAASVERGKSATADRLRDGRF